MRGPGKSPALAKRGEYQVTLHASNAAARPSAREDRGGRQDRTDAADGMEQLELLADSVQREKVRAAADAMVKSGLIDHGWTYINIDDCWEIKPNSDDPILKGERATPMA